jgi:hypothetical protein
LIAPVSSASITTRGATPHAWKKLSMIVRMLLVAG